jgi:membrane protein required for colicin V production
MLNWADWVIIAILGISSLISLKRGFVKEALSLAIWLIAFAVASWFGPRLSPLLTPYLDTPSLRQMAAFAGLFIATLVVGSAVNYLLSTLIKATGLSGTDRMLGVLFGLLRGLIIVMILVLYVPKLVPVNEDLWWQESSLIPNFLAFEDRFKGLVSTAYELLKGLIP